MSLSAKCMELKVIMVSEVSQNQKTIFVMCVILQQRCWHMKNFKYVVS